MNLKLKSAISLLLGLGLGLGASSSAWSQATLEEVMKERGLTQKEILSAAKTYTPTGGRDEYIAISSGGQSGHLIVYGIPSMRILKYVAEFTPEPWQGYGFGDESKAVLDDRVADLVDMSSRLFCRLSLIRPEDAFAKTIAQWGFKGSDAGRVWAGYVSGPDRLRFLGVLSRYAALLGSIRMDEAEESLGVALNA